MKFRVILLSVLTLTWWVGTVSAPALGDGFIGPTGMPTDPLFLGDWAKIENPGTVTNGPKISI